MPQFRNALPTVFLAFTIAFPLLVSRHTLPLATFYGEWAAAVVFVAFAGVLTATRLSFASYIDVNVPWIACLPFWLIFLAGIQTASGANDTTGSRFATQLTLALSAAVMLSACAPEHQSRRI